MDLPPLPATLPPWLEAEVAAAALINLPMSEREIQERLAAGVTHATVQAFLREQDGRRYTGGVAYEDEERYREEAIIELADRLRVTDERATALWVVAEEKLV